MGRRFDIAMIVLAVLFVSLIASDLYRQFHHDPVVYNVCVFRLPSGVSIGVNDCTVIRK